MKAVSRFARRALACAALGSILPLPAVAQDDTTATGVVRGASLMDALATYCPDVDRDLAHRYFEAFQLAGTKILTKPVFDRRYAQEHVRRAKEVATAGKVVWCASERATVEKMPSGDQIFEQ
jgi:hypothetical protein